MTAADFNQTPHSIASPDLKQDLKQRLIKRLQWMHTMRWFALGVAFLALISSWTMRKLSLPYVPLTILISMLATSNIAYNVICARFDVEKTSLTSINKLIYCEILLDFIMLACLIHFTGGAINLFSFYFVFHIVIASLLVPRKIGYGMAGAGVVLIGFIAVSEMNGLLPHYSLGPFEPPGAYRQPGYVIHFMAVFSGLLFIMAYIASNLRTMLQRRELFLTELKERLELWNRQAMIANERLKEIDRTKTQFMRLSGHEIRSPLNAMLSIMRTILEGYVKEEGKIIEMIGLADRRGNEALEITNKLLHLAKEKGKDLAPEEFDIVEETRREVEELRPFAIENMVRLEFTPSENGPISVFADRESFGLALHNIIENAIKYSYLDGRVSVQIDRWRHKGMILVVDHGIGIPDEFIPGIFDEFSRGKNARKHAPAGTGLGMPIVRQAAVNMGGSVTVRSISNQGTVVRLTIPLKPGAEAAKD